MRKFLTLLLLIGSALLYAGEKNDIVTVQAKYTYTSDNKSETPQQAVQTALQRARLKALEDRFGIDINQTNNTVVRNSQQGEEAKSSIDMMQISSSEVRGEWLETLKEEVVSQVFKDGFWVITVEVQGRARSSSAEKVQIQAYFVNDVRDTYPRDEFHDGDHIYLHFASPVAGYLCVYLVDEDQNAFCMLPYASNSTGNQTVEANKDYIFFDSNANPAAQGYVMTTQKSLERNTLYVIYSPNPITKAMDSQGGDNWRKQTLPRQLSFAALSDWLAKNQTRDRDMVVKKTPISIHP